MAKFRRVFAWLIASGFALANLVIRGGVVATVAYLGYLSFPIYLVLDLSAALFVTWLHGEAEQGREPWLQKKLRVSEANLRSESKAVRMMTFLALFLIALVLGTLFSAALIRGMGFKGRTAYILTIAITVPASLLWTGIYYGFVLAFKEYFA